MANSSLTKRTGINIASQWAEQTAAIVVNFFLISYAIGKLGAEHYGGWAGIVSIIGFVSILDSGMSVAIQHYVASLSAKKEEKRLAELFSSACVVYAIGAVAATLICLGISFYYPILFPKVPAAAAVESQVALRWVAASMFIFMLNMPVRGALLGLQRHDIRNMIEIVSLLTRAGAVVAAFHFFSPSLAHLGMGFFAATLIRFVLSETALRRISGYLKFSVSTVKRSDLKEIFSYSGHSMFWTVGRIVVQDSGPLIANITLTSTAATYVFVGSRLVTALGSFIIGVAGVFVPIASSLKALEDKTRLKIALIRGTRVCSLLGFAVAAVLLVFGRSILYHWVKFEDITPYLVMCVLVVGRTPTWFFNIALSMLMGMRELWTITLMLLISTVSTIVLMFALSYYFGVFGLAVGIITPLSIICSTWIPYRACRVTEVTIGRLLKESIPWPLAVGALVALFAYSILNIFPPETVFVLIIEMGATLAVFLVLALFVGLDRGTREVILSRVSLCQKVKK